MITRTKLVASTVKQFQDTSVRELLALFQVAQYHVETEYSEEQNNAIMVTKLDAQLIACQIRDMSARMNSEPVQIARQSAEMASEPEVKPVITVRK